MPCLETDPNDVRYRLPADAFACFVHPLNRYLPPPPDDSDETATLRKHAIIAQISALRPNDSVEAELAAERIEPTPRLIARPRIPHREN